MRFWDSSALVPLLVKQSNTRVVSRLFKEDPAQAVWWGTDVECASALARMERSDSFKTNDALIQAFARLEALRRSWHEVQPGDEIKEAARRFLRVHPIRAGDALQLAAAFALSERRPTTLKFICLDSRLTEAAGREGFVCRP